MRLKCIDMMLLFQEVVTSLVLAVALGAVIFWWMGIRQARTKINHQESLPNSDTVRPLTHVDEKGKDLSLPKLTPKHDIFLSHSGAQKPFVEQLCKDLEAACFYPFFDQRDDSLPKGKKFAELIFKAASQCRVAVIVLSKEFLSSKWPMLELLEFTKAIESGSNENLNMLPLFFKLSISDLSDEAISKTWMLEWTKLAKKDPRVNVQKWKKAVQKLHAVNGLMFAKFGGSEANYRDAVVNAIFKLIPPVLHNTSGVQGCDRVCEILTEMFVEHTPSSDRSLLRPQKLGLYGMGGLGKTTMCKALCNHFQKEFNGRVCHVELGCESPLTLQKKVLKNLLRVRDDLLERVTNASEGLKVLKEKLGYDPVFLAIDNVGDAEDSRDEACTFLRCNFHPSSKIMVVSRSKEVVEALLEGPEYCKPLPDLMIEEARALFLSKATAPKKEFSSLSTAEVNIVNTCLKECLFSPDGNTNADVLKKHGQYHPLALAALGVYFHDISRTNLLLWKKRLQEFDKLKRSRDCPQIFLILGLQFSTFDATKKLMFLDVSLYAHGWIGSFKLKSFDHWVKWLGALHGLNIAVVEDKLNEMQRNAMVTVGESAVTTHDLYKEYAEWYVSSNPDTKSRWCVYLEHAESLPHELKGSAPGGWWPDLMRISMEGNLRFSSKKVQEWRNIVVLQLHDCISVTELDLHGFSCLCHLELVGLTKLETLIFSADGDEEDVDPLELQFVLLMKLPALKHLPSFSPCTELRMFIMRDCSRLTEPLVSLESCSRVESFEMDWCVGRLCAPNLSAMTSLEFLSIVNTVGNFPVHPIEELQGLGNLRNLQFLNLSNLPIKRLPGLERLSNVRHISLEHCLLLTKLPDLSSLTQVELLNVSWTKLKEIRGLDQMLQLRFLDCARCVELESLPDLDHLKHLRIVSTRECWRLTKNPRVPKHPCFHDRHKIISTKKSTPSNSKSEDDVDLLDHFDPNLFEPGFSGD